VAGHLGAIVIEDHAAGTGGALIDGGYEFRELGQLVSSGVVPLHVIVHDGLTDRRTGR
jgi:hypothetical protein